MELEINNRPSPFVLVKTGSGIFSPTVPQAWLKNRLPHQYKLPKENNVPSRVASLKKSLRNW